MKKTVRTDTISSLDAVPAKVRAYFKLRGSRRRQIWVRQVHSRAGGWQIIDWASPRLVKKYGHQDSAKAWSVDTTIIQYTDGETFADFGRNELCAGGAR